MYLSQTVLKGDKPVTFFGVTEIGRNLGYNVRSLPREKMITSMRFNSQGAVIGVDEAGKAPTLRLVEVLGKYVKE